MKYDRYIQRTKAMKIPRLALILALLLHGAMVSGNENLIEEFDIRVNADGTIPAGEIKKVFARQILESNNCDTFEKAAVLSSSLHEYEAMKGYYCMRKLLDIKYDHELSEMVADDPSCWEERIFPTKRLVRKCAVWEPPKEVDGELIKGGYKIVGL